MVHGYVSVSFLSYLSFVILLARTRQVNGGETGSVLHRLAVLPVQGPGLPEVSMLMND